MVISRVCQTSITNQAVALKLLLLLLRLCMQDKKILTFVLFWSIADPEKPINENELIPSSNYRMWRRSISVETNNVAY